MLVIAALVLVLTAQSSYQDEYHPSSDSYHPRSLNRDGDSSRDGADQMWPSDEGKDFWLKEGGEELKASLERKENNGKAKNIILFIGDGMSIPTVTATRIYKGQQEPEGSKYGEEAKLSWEEFPNVALSRTYSVDSLVPDSASTAFAMYSGVKTIHFTMGYDSSIVFGDANSMAKATPVDTVLKWAQEAGWETGFVTTTRVTHATPACLYAKSAHRDWECDRAMEDGSHAIDGPIPDGVKDITRQLVEDPLALNASIILGGGLGSFTPYNDTLDEDRQDGKFREFNYNTDEWNCSRKDNVDLVQLWKDNTGGVFVSNKTELFEATSAENIANNDKILGLFSWSHMPFHDQHNSTTDIPTLAEMTETAIKFLQAKTKGDQGFFLMVESGRIDQAHHNGQAVRALKEGLALDKAVAKAKEMVNLEDSLLIVTADHSHTFSIGGYPVRGNNKSIGGVALDQWGEAILGQDGLPYTVLAYANGPGFQQLGVNQTLVEHDDNVNWTAIVRNEGVALDNSETDQFEFRQASGVPLSSETHGGDDVGIWAAGPMAHLFHGVHQQSYIGHVMSLAGCIGPYKKHERCTSQPNSSSLPTSSLLTISIILLSIFLNKYVINV